VASRTGPCWQKTPKCSKGSCPCSRTSARPPPATHVTHSCNIHLARSELNQLHATPPLPHNRKPWSVSEICAFCSLMRRRDGRTVRSTSNLQFFYGPTGIVRRIFS
jgi:hypothetical protein